MGGAATGRAGIGRDAGEGHGEHGSGQIGHGEFAHYCVLQAEGGGRARGDGVNAGSGQGFASGGADEAAATARARSGVRFHNLT
jgi:hypothetical protein